MEFIESSSQFTHFFDAEVGYVKDMSPVVSPERREGSLIGSGEGAVRGAEIVGTIRWSFFAHNCALEQILAGFEAPVGLSHCEVQPAGIVRADDGAEIRFDAVGFGVRGYDSSQPHLWRLTMAVQFLSHHPRFEWLNSLPAVLVSRFDESTNSGLWRVFVAAEAPRVADGPR